MLSSYGFPNSLLHVRQVSSTDGPFVSFVYDTFPPLIDLSSGWWVSKLSLTCVAMSYHDHTFLPFKKA